MKRGLCCNCRHADSCGFLARGGYPIVFCEEFQVDQRPEQIHASAITKLPQESVMDQSLCCSCAIKSSCKFFDSTKSIADCEYFVLDDY